MKPKLHGVQKEVKVETLKAVEIKNTDLKKKVVDKNLKKVHKEISDE